MNNHNITLVGHQKTSHFIDHKSSLWKIRRWPSVVINKRQRPSRTEAQPGFRCMYSSRSEIPPALRYPPVLNFLQLCLGVATKLLLLCFIYMCWLNRSMLCEKAGSVAKENPWEDVAGDCSRGLCHWPRRMSRVFLVAIIELFLTVYTTGKFHPIIYSWQIIQLIH